MDETLERNEALELEEVVHASIRALLVKEHNRKLANDANIFALAGKLFEEISTKVILESLNTLLLKKFRGRLLKKLP